MTASVSVVPSASADVQSSEWLYEIQPPGELPILDLSLSFKSRFLSRRALNRVEFCIQQRKLIGVLALVANASYPVTLLAPRGVGRAASGITLLSYIPVMVIGFSSLRYDIVKLLMRTYDFWFLSCVNLSVFAVLGVLMGDLRAVALLATWAGVQLNIMVDANIRRVRSWLYFNLIGIVVYAVTWIAISFQLIDSMQVFQLVHYRYHELPAASFVMSGLTTIIAVFARNVYRRRDMLRKRSRSSSRIECASYRTNLRFYSLASPSTRCLQTMSTDRSECIKPMQYLIQLGSVDARNTLLCSPALEHLKTAAACIVCPRHGQRLFSWLGVLALSLFASGALYFLRQELSHTSIEVACHVLEFVVTLIYCGVCAMHYHRVLLLALITSFDFAFLSAQLTAVYVCSCILFNWGVKSTLIIVTTWIWIHWFLCLDALPPVMKRKLGITKRFIVVVLLTLSAFCLMLCYLLVFTHLGSSEMYARVVVDFTIFGHHQVQIKLASVFFNCLVTSVALNCRLIWRAVTLPSDVLLVLDGVVVYENYLVKARVRESRRFGSLKTAKQSLPAPASAATRSVDVQSGLD
ncbi:hypothetical protein Gpo141_00013337 [Globisporangium polare]